MKIKMADFANRGEMEEDKSIEMEQEAEDDDEASDDCSDSSDGESDDVEISQLLEEVNSNPYQYDAHLKLITLLRQAGELEKLRKSRQNMSELFPLTADLWMQWIQDELKLVEGGEGREGVMQLFQKAVKDYLAVDVWLEYCQFSVGGIGTPEGVSEARRVFEAAIMAAGLHVAKGSMIWEVYREFENALLSTMQPQPGSIPSDDKQKELKEQMHTISKLFKRQLAIPLLDMEQTFCEYDQWISDIGEEIPGNVKDSYQKALDMLDNYRPLEDNLLTAEAPKLTEYLAYIEYELKQGNPARIQCIYERALEDNCLNMSLWKEYTTYLDENLKIGLVVLPVYERAVRNCPWSFALWQGYLINLERYEEPFGVIQSVFEKALVAGFSSATDYLQLWQTYVACLRRRVPWDQEHADELEVFRNTVERAIIYQAQYFNAEGDPNSSLQQYLAYVEAKYCQNALRMRELWNDIMSMGYASQAQMWLQYVHLERCYGDAKHVRKVFHRAIHSVSDWPEMVFEAFLSFEREEGSLETWCSAVKRVETQMKRVTEQRNRAAEQEASWSRQGGGDKNRPRGDRKGGKRLYDEPGTSKQQFKKQKKHHEPDMNSRNDKTQDRPSTSSSNTPAGLPSSSSDLPSSSSSSSSSATGSLSSSTSATGSSSSSSVFKVPQLPARLSGATVEETMWVDDTAMDSSQYSEETQPDDGGPKKSKKVDHHANKEPLTVFVKNLDYHLTEMKIRDVFSECGPINDVRMVTNYQKKFKGYCYIEFADEDSVKKALEKDRDCIDNRPMYIDPSKDTRKAPPEKKFKYENKMEKNKLFVTGLPRSITKEELQKMFGQYGELKEVRIVTYRSGIPKGLAYVDFQDEASASKAVIGLDNSKLGDHTVTVAISNPPTRKQPQKSAPPQPESDKKSLGSKGIVGPRGKGRTQVSLLPRSLQRKSTPSTKAKPDSLVAMETSDPPNDADTSAKAQTTKMSNADFAKLFTK